MAEGADYINRAVPVAHGHPVFVKVWKDQREAMQAEYDGWVAKLRDLGVKAARADDGWVDRKRNQFCMAYPVFDDAPGIGDLVALGEPGLFRLVQVTGIEEPTIFGLIWYSFEDR